VLHPQVTLQLCFLGCVVLREAVTFYDIMSWALDGQLPFLNAPDAISSHMTGAAVRHAAPPQPRLFVVCRGLRRPSHTHTHTLVTHSSHNQPGDTPPHQPSHTRRHTRSHFTHAESELLCLPIRCIQPRLVATPLSFYTSAAGLAGALGVALPAIAAEPLLLKAVKEMGLPLVRGRARACVCVCVWGGGWGAGR
jgi:hypothetical protein